MSRVLASLVSVLLLSPLTTALAQNTEKLPRVRKNQYKRVHEAALQLLTSQRAPAALAYLAECEKLFPRDPETAFMTSAAHCALGDIDAAVASMRDSIARGLPFARFVAGPRELFGPLHESAPYAELLARQPSRLVHGPMLGSVTDTTARVWVRIAPGVEQITVRARPAAGDAAAISATATPSADRDHTAVVALSGLRPSTTYRYEILLDDDESAAAAADLRTFPARGPCRFRIAFGGGSGYVPQHEYVWNTVRAQRPDALLLLGDNVYIDAPKNPAMQRYCYYRRQSRPEFRALVAGTPVFSIWDDHDFGTNDCIGSPEPDRPAWKPRVWRVFRDNWGNPGYGGGEAAPGCWYRFAIGDVEFFMLDGRYYRTGQKAEPPTMLGPVQKRWLLDAVGRSTATFKVLCSPVPWDYRTKGKSKDTWNGFRAERDEIFGFLAERRIDGVVLVSADRHRSDLWRIERDDGYALWELNSSRLTNQHVHPEMAAAEFSFNDRQSFGTVDFDTASAVPALTYRIVDIDGNEVFARTIRRTELRYRR